MPSCCRRFRRPPSRTSACACSSCRWTRGAREAADRLRRRCAARPLPARQHLDARARRARRARAARRSAWPNAGIAARRLLRRHPRHQRHADGEGTASSACPGTSTRACSSIAATCCARAGHAAAAARPGPSGWPRMRAVRRAGGGRSYGASAAAQRARPAATRWHCSKAPLLARRRHPRRVLAARRSGARSTSTRSSSATASRRR